MSEQEVERVARLMHEEFVRWWREQNKEEVADFDNLHKWRQEAYRAAARAVLADLCPEPVYVEPSHA